MEFWAESQGQSPMYAKFGTVPGRNCTHVYHDKHQAAHFQQYLCEQQDHGREPSCWTVPGSRTGGVLQDYTNWTDPELTAPASHFPFVLDSQPRQLQDIGAYRPQQEKREWGVGEAHRAMRDREGECERRILREGWQRRWEACSPVHYRREAPKRSLTDSSYRELEAWAARYSHSLPRRRRIEAELRGASQPQGLSETNRVLERDSRGGTEPRVAALHGTGLSANIRELEQWERESRQQPMTHYPSQPPVSDTTYMSDTKGKNTGYQRRMFSQPPGYIAPPPYNSPHNSSPVMHHCDRYSTGWEQEANRQIYCSQPTPRKQNVIGLQGERRGEEDFTKELWKQMICSDTAEHKQQIQATDHLLTGSPAHPLNTEIQPDCLSSSVQPQTEQKVQKTNTKSSSVIEGRKFSFNKKRGGQTIFCLVSRMGGPTVMSSSPKEPLTPSSLPLITPSPQANIKSPDIGEVSRCLGDYGEINLEHKFADEVDFNVPPLQVVSVAPAQPTTPKMSNLKAKLRKTQNWMESEQAAAHREELLEVIPRRVKQRENQLNKTEGDVAFTEKSNINNTNPEFGRQSVQSLPTASVKYPLWREPGYTGRVKSESSSPCCLKAGREEGESGQGLSNREGGPEFGGHPFDIEVRRLEIKNDTESENSGGFVVIDTTCVIVRVELIPPPKKEHVHYLSSSPHSEHNPPDAASIPPTESIESDDQRTQEITQEESKDTSTQVDHLPNDEMPETESKESDQDKVHNVSNAEVTETDALLQAEEESQISSPSLPSPSNSERETLEERAERILGIPLLDDLIQHQTRDAISSVDLCAQDQNGEGETSQLTNDEINDVIQHQTRDAISFLDSCVQDQNEDGETSQLTSKEMSDVVGSASKLVMEQPVSQQPLQLGTAEDAACVAESDVNQEQLPKDDNKDLTDLCEQTLNISKETAIDYQPETEIKQPLEPGKSEDAACVAENGVTQDLSPKQDEDLADFLEQASIVSKQNAIDSQPETEVKHPLELGKSEVAACVAEGDFTQDQLPMEDEDLPNLSEQTFNIPEQKAIDCQPETEVKQPLQLGKFEDAACVTENDVIQDHLPKEDEDLTDILEKASTISEQKAIDCQPETEVKPLELPKEEDDTCVTESDITQDQLSNEDHEDLADMSEQISNVSKENAIDYQPETEVKQPLQLGKSGDAACVTENDDIQDQLPKEDEDLTDLLEQASIDCQPETEVKQPLQLGKSEEAFCVAESNATQDQLPMKDNEDLPDLCEQTCNIPEQKAIDCQLETGVKQPLQLGKSEDAVCVAESNVTQDQLPMRDNEDLPDLCEQTSNIPEQKAIDCQPETDVEQPLELPKKEDDTCVIESDVTQDQLSNEDHADLSESKENAIDCQPEIEVQSLQEIADESFESYCSQQEKSQEAKDQGCDSDVFPQLPSQSLNSPSNQANLFPHSPSDFLDGQKSPSAFDFMPPLSQLTSPSHILELNTEPLPFHELSPLSSSSNLALNPEALESGTSETAPSSHIKSQTPPQQFPSPPPYPSVSLPPPSSSPPSTSLQCLDISDESIPPDFSPSVEHREKPQYPKSLWDAVNRIRKHTAPDSENEEEELGELWDRESTGEDFASLDVEVDLNTADPVFRCSEELQAATSLPLEASGNTKEKETLDEPEQLEVPVGDTVEDVVIGETEQDKCHEEQRGRVDDDALSCSSTNSHGSDDTVIVGAEGEVEEKISDSETEEMEIEHEGEIKTDEEENKTNNCKPCVVEEEELTSDDRLTNKNVVEEGEVERNDKVKELNESCENQGCLAEVENNISETVEKSEKGKTLPEEGKT